MDARDRLIALLREHALVIGDVVLTSGARASYYVDAKRAILLPGRLRRARRAGRARRPRALGRDGGRRADDGRRPGRLRRARRRLRGKAFFVRKEAKAHGLARRIEGPLLEPGDRCAVVEDVVSTGGSTLTAIAALREAGLEICGVISVLDRLMGGARGDRGGGGRALRRAEHDRRRLSASGRRMRRALLLRPRRHADLRRPRGGRRVRGDGGVAATAGASSTRRALAAAAARAGARAVARDAGPRLLPADPDQLVGGALVPLRGRGRATSRGCASGRPPTGARRGGTRSPTRGSTTRRSRVELGERFGIERRAPHEVFADVEAALDELAGEYALALVTNGASCLQREKLAASGLAERFDAVVVSGELGIGKPDPAIFAHALAALGAQAATR